MNSASGLYYPYGHIIGQRSLLLYIHEKLTAKDRDLVYVIGNENFKTKILVYNFCRNCTRKMILFLMQFSFIYHVSL